MPYQLSDQEVEKIVNTVIAEGAAGNLKDYAAIASVIANRAEMYGVSPAAVVGPKAEFNGTAQPPGTGKYRDIIAEIVKDVVVNGNRTTTATYYGMEGHKPSVAKDVELGEVSVPGAVHKFYTPTTELKSFHSIRTVDENGNMRRASPVMQPDELMTTSVAFAGQNPMTAPGIDAVENILSGEDLQPITRTLENVKSVPMTPRSLSFHDDLDKVPAQGFRQTTPETVRSMARQSFAPGSLNPRQTAGKHLDLSALDNPRTIRDDPIQQEVIGRVDAIAEHLSQQRGTTITAVVSSGGQTNDRSTPKGQDWTGSHRHDTGWSTDITLEENGVEYLPDENPDLYASFAGLAAQSGLQGIGIYNHSIHVGTPVEQTETSSIGTATASWNGVKDKKTGQMKERASKETAKAVFDAVEEGRKQFNAGNPFGVPASTRTPDFALDPNAGGQIASPYDQGFFSPQTEQVEPEQRVAEALATPNRFPGMGDIPERVAGVRSTAGVDPSRLSSYNPHQTQRADRPALSPAGMPAPSGAPYADMEQRRAAHFSTLPDPVFAPPAPSMAFNPTDNLATDAMFTSQQRPGGARPEGPAAGMPSYEPNFETPVMADKLPMRDSVPGGTPIPSPSPKDAPIDPGRFANSLDDIGFGMPEGVLPGDSLGLGNVNVPTPTPSPNSAPVSPDRFAHGYDDVGFGMPEGVLPGDSLASAVSRTTPTDNRATELMFANQQTQNAQVDPNRFAVPQDEIGFPPNIMPGSSLRNAAATTPQPPAMTGPPRDVRERQVTPYDPPAAPGTANAVAASVAPPSGVRSVDGATFDKELAAGAYNLDRSQYSDDMLSPKPDMMPDRAPRGGIGKGVGGILGALAGGVLGGPLGGFIGNLAGRAIAGGLANAVANGGYVAKGNATTQAAPVGGGGSAPSLDYSGRTPGDRAISPSFQPGGVFGATSQAARDGGMLGGMTYL